MTRDNEMSSNFKVIVAGGGPAGLVAAHSLHLAGIDFTVLEQRDQCTNDQGASLVLRPQNMRVMHQFGIFDRLMEIGAEMKHSTAFSWNGQQFGDSTSFSYIKDNHGIGPVAFHRAQLIQTIYDGLPEEAKARVLNDKKIVNVASDDNGVTVTCTDGSVYEGSVLIGADGVHSKTRRQMREMAVKSNATIKWDPDVPFASEYKCLWCSFPAVTEPGEASETHNKDRSAMYLAGKTRGWIFLYEKLPEKTKARISYTDEDVIAFAESFGNYPITSTLKVKDVFAKRYTAGMSTLEEGVADHWSWGRVALVGDAAHKYTPNAGLGLNNGIQDVVSLCNALTSAVRAAPNNNPSLDSLTKVFEAYQTERQHYAQDDCSMSARITRTQADANPLYYFFGHYIMWMKVVQYFLFDWLTPREVSRGLILDYVSCEEPLTGKVNWLHPLKAPSAT